MVGTGQKIFYRKNVRIVSIFRLNVRISLTKAKYPTAVNFDVRRGENPQVGLPKVQSYPVAPMPPPPTQPPPKFSPPSLPIAPKLTSQPITNPKSEPRKLKDEIVKVSDDHQPAEDYYRSCFQ